MFLVLEVQKGGTRLKSRVVRRVEIQMKFLRAHPQRGP